MQKLVTCLSKIIRIQILLILVPIASFASNSTIVFDDNDDIIQVNSGLTVYTDYSSQLNVNQVLKLDSFTAIDQKVPNLGVSTSSFWIKFNVINNSTKSQRLILTLAYPILDLVEFYEIESGQGKLITVIGDQFSYSKRKYKHQNFLFDLNVNQGESKDFILKIKSWELITVPLSIGTFKSIFEYNLTQDLIFGVFLGIMLVLILYNMFIYFTVKDNSYLYYVIYITFITFTQATLYGYTFRLFFSDFPIFTNLSLILFNSLAALASLEFLKFFLKTKRFVPTLHKGLHLFTAIYIIGIITALSGFKSLSYSIMDLGGMLIAFYTLFIAIKISIAGYRPAKIFLAAWSVFLIGVIFFVLKSVGILPSNIYTNYTMAFGLAIEGIILSIALADRINILRTEKEKSQNRTVEVLKDNERIIKDQNIVLEQKVNERTQELNSTLVDLKQTQTQLVDAEKMSSLGQLTAGIAHEINNPINFVSSNILPLRQDIDDINTILNKYEELERTENIPEKLKEIDDLKKELDYDYLKVELAEIINGIEDGARRTTEIVSGLKNFSRLDEGEFKYANLNEGIESTFLLVKSKLDRIIVELDLGDIPKYDCNPGKINQLILNIIDNAIYATKKNNKDNKDGLVKIKTSSTKEEITLSITDNGSGISKENIPKLFDPFFTTKDVGEGTGLGLSIVKGILDAHNAKINVESTENKGTEITITFPLKA
tara:strand:- start:58 stop:2199 length:2142 start_codon:yes stop_codon:yes gene_type:complete